MKPKEIRVPKPEDIEVLRPLLKSHEEKYKNDRLAKSQTNCFLQMEITTIVYSVILFALEGKQKCSFEFSKKGWNKEQFQLLYKKFKVMGWKVSTKETVEKYELSFSFKSMGIQNRIPLNDNIIERVHKGIQDNIDYLKKKIEYHNWESTIILEVRLSDLPYPKQYLLTESFIAKDWNIEIKKRITRRGIFQKTLFEEFVLISPILKK